MSTQQATKTEQAMEVGTVLCAVWGYSATLVTFYEVVAATAKICLLYTSDAADDTR